MLRTQGNPDNPPIVFIHGFLGNHLDWSAVIDALSQQWFCLSIDLPGHGERGDSLLSNSGESELNLLFDSIISTIDKPFNLLGYSLGGRIAMLLAHQHPGYILSLSLESSHPGLLTQHEKQNRIQADKKWASLFLTQPLNLVLREWYQQPVFNCHNNRKLQQLVESHLGQSGAQLSKALTDYSLGIQKPYWDFLSQWNKPLLYISGKYDGKFCSIGADIKNINPYTQHITLEQSAHNCHDDQPQAFIDTLSRFLNNNRSLTSAY